MRILDNEGELVVELTDVVNKADLDARLEKEDQQLMDVLYDTPFFADPVGPESQYDNTEESCEGMDCVTMTYEEWMSGCREWASECLGE